MPIPAVDILSRTATILNDEEHVRWTVPELLDWMNDAAGEIVIRRPQAGVVVQSITLAAGPMQSLPERSVQLIDVVRNVPGKSISRAARRLLDAQVPDWYDARQTDKIRHFTLEEETPTHFYVYPPAKAGAVVEVKYSAAPPLVTSEAGTLQMDTSYIGPLVSYMLYRALAKDSEYANGQVAMTHFQAFNEALGTNNAITTAVTANAGAQ